MKNHLSKETIAKLKNSSKSKDKNKAYQKRLVLIKK